MDYYFGFARELLEKGLAYEADPYGSHNLYDMIVQFSDDVDFYSSQAGQAGGKVLDLACGSGRILKHLVEEGIDVVGLDLSGEMLQLARKKLGDCADQVELVQGDMRSFSLSYRFNLIMIPYCSLIYMKSDEERLAVFERCYAHLNPGGRLIFDFLAGEVLEGESWPTLALQGIHPFTNEILLSVVQIKGLASDLRLLNQINYRLGQNSEGTSQVTVQHSVEAVVRPHRVQRLLEQTGFVVKGVYTNHTLKKYDNGEECLIIAERPH